MTFLTRQDVIRAALEHLGILATGEPAPGEVLNHADDALTRVCDEFTVTQGVPLDGEQTTPGLGHALSRLLAAEIAPHYELASEPRHRATARVRAYLLRDDRSIRSDANNDSIVSEAEAAARDRAAYY